MAKLSSLRAWVLLGVLLAAAAPAAGGDNAVELHADVVSRYVFRGTIVDDAWSLQPRLVFDFALGEATWLDIEAWWNVALETQGSPTHQDELFEQDLTLSLSHELSETVLVWAGSVYYLLPFSDVDPETSEWSTTEVAAGVEWTPGPVAVDGTLYYDLDSYQGWYLDLNSELEMTFAEVFAAVPGLHLGFAQDMDPDPSDPDQDAYYEDNGLVDGDLALGLRWSPSEVFSLGVTGHYTRRFDGVDEDESFTWVGLGVSYTP